MITCYDTASLTFRGGVPDDAESIIFYQDGHFANQGAARVRFPHLFAKGWAIGLTVLERVPAGGDDFEPGNARGDVGQWCLAAIRAGVRRPIVYADETDMDTFVIAQLGHAFGRPLPPPGPTRRFRTILAKPDGDPTIPAFHDGKQYWWGSIQGNHQVDYDKSSLRDDFFGPRSVTPPKPPALPEGTVQLQTYKTAVNTIGLAVLTDKGEVLHIEQEHATGDPAGSDWWRKSDGTPNWLSLGRPGQ